MLYKLVIATILPLAVLMPFQSRAVEAPVTVQKQAQPVASGEVRFTGRVATVTGTRCLLVLRNGKTVQVDGADAAKNNVAVALSPGMAVMVQGSLSSTGLVSANRVLHAKDNPSNWPPDVN